jgi:hypothetical protein
VPDSSTDSGPIVPTVAVDLAAAAPTPVASNFLGLSLEWNSVLEYLGDGASGARASTVVLLAAFAAEGHAPQLRIGGNSQDLSWWNPAAMPRPPGVTYDITPAHLSALAAVQSALGTDVVVGLNLAWGDATNAVALVGASRAAMPSASLTFELGNEPDAYVPDHRTTYLWPMYRAEVDTFADAIAARASPVRLQWPALARPWWRANLISELPSERDRFAVVSTHVYPYTVCAGQSPPDPRALLTEWATASIASGFSDAVGAAHRAGFTYRMGEMNSVSCGGAPGVSDVYAAALWTADIAMQLCSLGADGVNFHGGANTYYGAFHYEADGTLRVLPVYYGLRLVSLLTAAHGRLAPVSVSPSTARIHGFATIGDDGATRVLLLDLGGSGATLALSAGASTRAELTRLSAPAVDASTGLVLGGLTWDGSQDGHARGAPQTQALVRQDATWLVPLGAYDAALVELR